MNTPIDYERPGWTGEEMRQTPPFTYSAAEMVNIDARVKRLERRTDWLVVACVVVIVASVAALVVVP